MYRQSTRVFNCVSGNAGKCVSVAGQVAVTACARADFCQRWLQELHCDWLSKKPNRGFVALQSQADARSLSPLQMSGWDLWWRKTSRCWYTGAFFQTGKERWQVGRKTPNLNWILSRRQTAPLNSLGAFSQVTAESFYLIKLSRVVTRCYEGVYVLLVTSVCL